MVSRPNFRNIKVSKKFTFGLKRKAKKYIIFECFECEVVLTLRITPPAAVMLCRSDYVTGSNTHTN